MRYTMTVNPETGALSFTVEIDRQDIEATTLSDNELGILEPITLSEGVGFRVLAVADLVSRIEERRTEPQTRRSWSLPSQSVTSAVDGFVSAAGRVRTSKFFQRAEKSLQAARDLPFPNVKNAADQVTIWFNATLGSADFSLQLDGWMRDTFASGAATVYDRAMDANYIATHIGGGYHRLFDGGHTVRGAWEAIQGEELDAPLLEQVQGCFLALMKDFVTPMGLPFATISKESFDGVSEALSDHIGVSNAWLVDAVTLTATELLGSVIGVVSVTLNWSNSDVQKFSGLVGSMGLSSLASGNPVLLVVAVVALARAYQKAAHGDDIRGLAKGVVKGGLGTGFSLAVASLAPPVWIGVIVIICFGVLSGRAFDKGEQVFRDTDWAELSRVVQAYLVRAVHRIQSRYREIEPSPEAHGEYSEQA